jgi:hypothetical protein
MTDGARVMRRHLRAWRAPRTGAVVIATAALGLLAAACSGSPSSAGSGGSTAAGGSAGSPSAVAYSACMRSHGVPNFPDPSSSGQVPKPDPLQLGVSTPGSRPPKDLASTCTRATAGRSAPRSGNARKPATARRPWCTR